MRCLQWFGNYTPTGETPIILMPERHSCSPYIYMQAPSFLIMNNYSPEGTYAVITKHGELYETRDHGGMYFCLPWVNNH